MKGKRVGEGGGGSGGDEEGLTCVLNRACRRSASTGVGCCFTTLTLPFSASALCSARCLAYLPQQPSASGHVYTEIAYVWCSHFEIHWQTA